MLNPRKFLTRLTANLEAVTYLLGVPLGILFVIFQAGFSGHKLIIFLVSATVGVLASMLYPVIRWRILAGDISACIEGQVRGRQRRNLLRRLLNYPFWETIGVNIQWAGGIAVVVLTNHLLEPLSMREFLPYVFVFIFLAPINAVSHYLAMQLSLAELIRSNRIFHGVFLRRQDLVIVSLFRKTLGTMFSGVWLLLVFFGYTLYALSIGYIDVAKLRLMTVAAAAQAVVLVAALSFIFATYLNQFVLYLTRLLGRVASGDLTAKMTMASTDEIGALSTDFNRVTRSLRNARGQLESYATSLEEKVQIRTEQLNATLSEVRTVKEKQDGDYYLTSLLLRPFLRAGLQTHSVEAAALISQFKKFEFRHFKEQIGGDSVTLDHVRLQGRDYVFFMNSDAMGKSMQGAGGALVLGAVMHAYLQRTRVSRQAHDVFPESWLNRLRMELQGVFESFEGSMMISAIIGLLDGRTGCTYFINAEHPSPVLFREGQVTFASNGQSCFKLGSPMQATSARVFTMRLLPGDVLICGSDGRDDLRLADSAGINTDETLFLRLVADANGDLTALEDALRRTGEIMDDLSLVRIAYKGHREESHQPFDAEIENFLKQTRRQRRRQVDDLCKERKFDSAMKLLEGAALEYPWELEMLGRLAYVLRKTGNLHRAADLGESIRLREPDNVDFLWELARTQGALGNRDRVRTLLEGIPAEHMLYTRAQEAMRKL